MSRYIANWLNAEEYPPLGCKDKNCLAWEFLRRNLDYADHVSHMRALLENEFNVGLKKNSTSMLHGLECWPPCNEGETAKEYFHRMRAGKIRHGRIDKPCNTFANLWGLQELVSPADSYQADRMNFVQHDVKLKRYEKLITKNFRLFIYPNEVAVRFRLDLPINKQLESARTRLLEVAKKYEVLQRETKQVHKGDWPNHARSELVTASLLNVHYWLRCYDANQEPKTQYFAAPKLRRALKSGPGQQLKKFNSEIKEKKLAGKNERTEFLSLAAVKSYAQQAKRYIEDKQFLLLLAPDVRL